MVSEAHVGPEDSVFEVGTGPGTLTRQLALRARHVLTVDLDRRLLAFACRELKDFTNVTFLCADALEGKARVAPEVLEALRRLEPFVWVSNLPYGIASTLIVALCESGLRWDRAALTVQAEVAARLAAQPGEPAYGPITALTAFWADARLGRIIPPGAFWPPPRVTSRVIHLERRDPPLGPVIAYAAYRAWVKRLFVFRRKQLGGVLRRTLGEDGAGRAMGLGGWGSSQRPESLGPADFLRLAQEFPVFHVD